MVSEVAVAPVVVVRADEDIAHVRAWISTHAEKWAHQGFPIVDDNDRLVGVVTRRDLLNGSGSEGATTVRGAVRRAPVVVFDDSSLRDAADLMAHEGVGRLPVVARDEPDRVIGILTRSDVIAAHTRRLEGERLNDPKYRLPRRLGRTTAAVRKVSPP